jgi:hypothetical protein
MNWEACDNFMHFMKHPLTISSLSNSEPLLRIFLKNDKIHVNWHHILLDAVGISMVMQELFELLISKRIASNRNYSLFLNHYKIKNLAKTESATGSPIIFERRIKAVEKIELEMIAEKYDISLQELFLLLSHSIFDRTESIGYTDNSQQIGIPGMYTILKTSSLSHSKEISKLLRKDTTSERRVLMVTNFMHSIELPDPNIQILGNEIKSCKYPYELQIEVSNNGIQLQFIVEEKNPVGEQKSKQLFGYLEEILAEKTLNTLHHKETNLSNIHFEEFDF